MQAVTDEMFVLVQIRDDDTQEIIRLTGQQKAVQYLIGVLYPLLETLDGLAFMALQRDADEGRDLKAAGPHVDIRGVANDHTSLFEKAHPSQARGRGEVHAFCQVLVGQPAIALQLPNDLAILSINLFHWQSWQLRYSNFWRHSGIIRQHLPEASCNYLGLPSNEAAMNQQHPASFATRAIHFGHDPAQHEGALTPPLHLTSTYAFDSVEAGAAKFAGEVPGHIYSRISNPTLDLLERRCADLEGAEAGLALASGMGAICSVFWTFLSPGDEVITDNTLYGCTFAFMRHGLAKFGITITHADLTDPEALRAALSPRTRIVYFETPANPNMRLVDIAAVSAIAKAHGAMVIVDNTYATPVLTRPIQLGADIVVHSATKYMGGHGDLVGGIAVGRAEDMAQVRLVGMKDMTGAVMAPFNAMLVLRGLKTLKLRMERHCASAMTVARMLETHPAVAKVHYPGVESFPQHALATRQMPGFGAMIAFELRGGLAAGRMMMNRLELIRRAVSLGDAETLIQHPASMTHSTYTPEERAAHGITEGLIRLSVGLEEAEDILADLDQALGVPASLAA